MFGMAKTSTTPRGDVMRRIAATYAKLDSVNRSGGAIEQRLAKRQALKQQLDELKQRMLAP
jgi:hypothetical protein